MNETVKILNLVQSTFYVKHGVKPVDVQIGYEDKLVFVFDKQQTKQVWKLWKQSCIEHRAEKMSV